MATGQENHSASYICVPRLCLHENVSVHNRQTCCLAKVLQKLGKDILHKYVCVCVVIFAEVSREQTRCSRSGVDTIRILLNTCWLGGMCTVISACWELHAHYYTLSCTHSITHMYEGERAPWWVSSNPAPARVPDNPAFTVIIMHTCKQTH